MQIFLPIAGVPVDVVLVLFLSVGAGILSGIFGIGGGVLMTPVLIFMGIPPAVAVSSSANQIIASSFSGCIAHFKRHNVDIQMGALLSVGGFCGSFWGVKLFSWMQHVGAINEMISVSYVLFLGTIGSLMFAESLKVIRNKQAVSSSSKTTLLQRLNLPFEMYFPHSKLTISMIAPLLIGMIAGILVSIMGIGGGFIMVPAMIYVLGMTTQVAVGTSLFQIIFTTIVVTYLQAVNTYTVDIVLTMLMLAGSVTGAQIGSKVAVSLPAERLRMILSVLILLLVIRLIYGLIAGADHITEFASKIADYKSNIHSSYFNNMIYDLAHNHSVFYALSAITIALMAGLVAGLIFNK